MPETPAAQSQRFERINSTRTFETAIDHIVEGIERARLRSGDRLPQESSLAGELGISVPTLRQALRVLERAGLLAIRRGRDGGIFLAVDLIPDELIRQSVAVEEDKVADILLARRVVESGVTFLAARNASEADLGEIERTVDLLQAHVGNRPLVMRADAAFHRAVARAAHNPPLERTMRHIGRDLAPIRDTYRGGEEVDAETVDVHRRQLAAMRAGDDAQLGTVLDEHFQMLEEAFAESVGRPYDELFGVRGEG
jgi:GntR family transcriptional repressor for pyruvate dehydrogenase complex